MMAADAEDLIEETLVLMVSIIIWRFATDNSMRIADAALKWVLGLVGDNFLWLLRLSSDDFLHFFSNFVSSVLVTAIVAVKSHDTLG